MGNRLLLITCVSIPALMLSGCLPGTPDAADQATEAEAPADGQPATETPEPKRVGKDIEAPEIFETTERALWDGTPSLGGVWVAHPDVTSPERVIVRNHANGKDVIAALFKRERDLPGPRIQVSSDAAASLGLLAGQPVEMTITALRRPDPASKKKEEPQPEAAASDASTANDEATGGAAEEDQPKPKRSWNPFRRPAAAATTAAAVTAADATAADAPAAETPPPTVVSEQPATRGWNPFRRKPKPAAETVAASTDAAGTEATAALAVETVTTESLD